MTDTAKIEAVRRRERVDADCSMHDKEIDAGCGYVHSWRVIVCDSTTDMDVLECARCGKQKVAPCSFDDDFA